MRGRGGTQVAGAAPRCHARCYAAASPHYHRNANLILLGPEGDKPREGVCV